MKGLVWVGSEVRRVKPGDKVVSPFWFSCGRCAECLLGHYTSCTSGGCYGFEAFWSAGGDVQGGQSEFVRVPMADGSLDVVPEALADDAHDTTVLPVADVLGTAYHAVAGAGIRPGNTVMVVIDAVSSADSIAQAVRDVRPYGTVSWVGMEVFLGAPQVPWDVAFLRNVTIKGGVAPTHAYATDLWPLLAHGRLDPSPVFSHDLALDQAPDGYAAMATRAEGSIKACLTP